MSNTLALYTQAAEDELGRAITSDDGARNLVSGYVQRTLDLIYSAHPFLWLLVDEGDSTNDIAIVAGDFLKTLPTSLLDIRNLRLIQSGQVRWVMTPRALTWIDQRWPDPAQVASGPPVYYSRVSQTQVKFTPKADASYTLRFRYTIMPVPLAGSTVSRLPSHLDWLVAEGAAAFGLNRLRLFAERDARMGIFRAGLQQAIEEDKNQLQEEFVMAPYEGAGAVNGPGLPVGNYWEQPDIRGVR